MSLIGVVPANHPQQTAKGRGDPRKDERFTRLEDFMPYHRRWRFTVDAAGHPLAPVSRVIARWWEKKDDGLTQNWDGHRVWCNPPYSNIAAWVRKAWASQAIVTMMLPANRTEQPWWQEMIEPHRDQPFGLLRVRFPPGRGVFGTHHNPHAAKGCWSSSAPFACVFVEWTSPWRPDCVPGRNA